MERALKIEIADVSVCIQRCPQCPELKVTRNYCPFISIKEHSDIFLRLQNSDVPNFSMQQFFDCEPIWCLYRHNGTSVIKVYPSSLFSGQERTLVFSPPFQYADLYFPNESSLSLGPFYGPTMELMMINYLAQGMGAVIHACGIERAGKGILFVGESGAGKSTLANMWAQEADVDVLSDDRIIVRKKGDRFWMYGTPWHGEVSFVSPRGVTVERVLFLRQGRENSIKDIKGIDSVSRLITCGFLPHWDPQGMAFSVDFLTDLAAHVPCSEFTFKPDRSAIELVKEITA